CVEFTVSPVVAQASTTIVGNGYFTIAYFCCLDFGFSVNFRFFCVSEHLVYSKLFLGNAGISTIGISKVVSTPKSIKTQNWASWCGGLFLFITTFGFLGIGSSRELSDGIEMVACVL